MYLTNITAQFKYIDTFEKRMMRCSYTIQVAFYIVIKNIIREAFMVKKKINETVEFLMTIPYNSPVFLLQYFFSFVQKFKDFFYIWDPLLFFSLTAFLRSFYKFMNK